FDAVAAALEASETVGHTLRGSEAERLQEPAPPLVMEKLREGLTATSSTIGLDADVSLRLMEAVRVLALRHGPAAVRHCTRLVETLRELLDTVTETGEASRG